MNLEDKLKLIKRNTFEILTEDELINILKTKENPSVYIGTATTGRPHIGYFCWAQKLADFPSLEIPKPQIKKRIKVPRRNIKL